MLKDPQTPRYAQRRTHRTYTPQFKAELVAACRQPGASVAAVALQHGMNANVLHRWLKEWAQGLHRLEVGVSTAVVASQPPAFTPIDLSAVSPASAGELPVASRTIIWSLVKQVRVGVMPLFHGLHRRTALER